MKKFILKTMFFIIPFIILYALNTLFYNPKEGDLVRLGYLYSNPLPKSLVENQYKLNKRYTLFSEIDLITKRKFEVFTIGDSFSEVETLGYKNFLANKGVSVLHFDSFFAGRNPMQTLIQLLNSNFFDYISTDYVVLQSVEREFNKRNKHIEYDMTINFDSLSNDDNRHQRKKLDNDLRFFSEATLKAGLTNIQYYFTAKPKYSKTYKYKSINNNLFSNSPNELLFYQNDINNLNIKNDSLSISQSIKVIEYIKDRLAKKNIKLIMLISPDKYDLYYPFIEGNSNYDESLFFDIYKSIKKSYIDVDSYKILSKSIKSEKDIYYYDDTHWSPKGAKIIANEIYNIISK